MKHQRPTGTEDDGSPPPAELHPALRQALMRVNPEYFAWPLEAQERYRVSMPEQDERHIHQALRKALFGLDTKPDEALPHFSDKENLMFNRAILPVNGVGEDYFFLHEWMREGKTVLDFDTLYEYDYDDHCFQEQRRKDDNPEYIIKPYRGDLYATRARLFIDGVFHYALLSMAAKYIYGELEEFGQEKVATLIPHRYVKAKDHGKREGWGRIFSRRLEADGKEPQLRKLLQRCSDYLSQRYDALLTEFDGQARNAIYLEDKSSQYDPHVNVIFSDKTALQSVRFRHFMRDCRPLVTDRAELDLVVTRERQALNDYLESTCQDIFANFDPKDVPFRKKHKVIIADGVLDDIF